MLAVLYISAEAPDRCQSMEENDEDQSYHRLNAICCTNGAARALLALASPIVSVLGIILAVLNLVVLITLPFAILTCRGGINIGESLKSLKFAFQNMIPYPIFAGKALLKKLHPCACWGCAEKLDQCTDGVKYKTKVDDEQELTQV